VKAALSQVFVLTILSSVIASPAEAMPAPARGRSLVDAAFVRPLYGSFKHCEGACLKSGSLSWFCFQRQDCYLSCTTAPPTMKCAIP
jgi:hypothetical protein